MQIKFSNTFIIEKCQMNGNFYSVMKTTLKNIFITHHLRTNSVQTFSFGTEVSPLLSIHAILSVLEFFQCFSLLVFFHKTTGSNLNNFATPNGNSRTVNVYTYGYLYVERYTDF